MKIVKLHKPQRMGSLENVLAYSGEEEDPNPPNTLAVPDSTSTDSTAVITSSGVQETDRGWSQTLTGDLGDRITFEVSSPIWIDAADDSTEVDTLRVELSGPGASINIAIPLPGGGLPLPLRTLVIALNACPIKSVKDNVKF